jgi:hypothetical protein
MSDDGIRAPIDGFASSVDGTTYAVAEPSTSQLHIRASPNNPDALLHLVAVALREELMHGERQKFAVPRNCHLLKREARRALHRYVSGETTAEAAADIIVRCRAACRGAKEGRRFFLETIDKYLTLSSFDDPGYLEEQLERHAERQDIPVADVREAFEWDRTSYRRSREFLQKEYRNLRELETDFTRTVAEAVGHVALDEPVLLQPLGELLDVDHETTPPWEVGDARLRKRFDRAKETVRTLAGSTDVTSLGRDELRRRIKAEMEVDRTNPAPLRDLPLLDRPSRTLGADQVTRQGFEAIERAPTEIDMVLNGAFQFVGNFGGVIYQRDDGDWASLVNPWVADDPSGYREYRRRWLRDVGGDRLVRRLLEYADEGDDVTTLRCVLCELSRRGRCGDDGCEWEPMTKLRNPEVREPLVDALGSYDLGFVTERGDRKAVKAATRAVLNDA